VGLAGPRSEIKESRGEQKERGERKCGGCPKRSKRKQLGPDKPLDATIRGEKNLMEEGRRSLGSALYCVVHAAPKGDKKAVCTVLLPFAKE
jgi:hypothetical protein